VSTEKMFPILLQFRDVVAGNGFVAHVLMDGRALLVAEDDGDHWVYGVKPGAVAGGAADVSTALTEFQTQYRSVLFAIASEASTFDEFKREVQAFFEQTDSDDEAWFKALDEVRKSKNVSLDDLPIMSADLVPSKIRIAEVVQAQPAMNDLGQVSRAA